MLHNEAESIYEDFEIVYESKELFRDIAWKEMFNRMKSFSELSLTFLDVENEYIHEMEESEEEYEKEVETSVSDEEAGQNIIENTTRKIIEDFKVPLHPSGDSLNDPLNDDPLSDLLGDTLDLLIQEGNQEEKSDKILSSRQWKSVELPSGWLEEEEKRRSQPGDAVYDGPTARIQTNIHRE